MDMLIYGAAGAVATLVAVKGLPAAWTTLSGWWTKGKTELATLKGDIASTQSAVASHAADITNVQGDLAALKARLDKAGIAA